MKIANTKQFEMPGTSGNFIHLATIKDTLDEYVCFRESNFYAGRRRVRQPFPEKPQVYFEKIKYKPALGDLVSVQLEKIDCDEEWSTLVGFLIDEEIIREQDLTEGYHDIIATVKTMEAEDA